MSNVEGAWESGDVAEERDREVDTVTKKQLKTQLICFIRIMRQWFEPKAD